MIFTSNYDNAKEGNLASLDIDGGKRKNFDGKIIDRLVPPYLVYKIWDEDRENNLQFFINQYYYRVLINSKYILKKLVDEYGSEKDIILLSYENADEISHRYMVSALIENEFGITVPELLIEPNGKYNIQSKNPGYIKDRVLKLVMVSKK